MRRLVPLLVIAAGLLLAVVGYRMFFASTPGPGAQAGGPAGGGMPPVMVETVRVKLSSLPDQFETVASVRAQESITVRPEIAGRIEKIHFAEGQQVAAGTLLFTLDGALARADLNEADANLQNTRRSSARATELAGKQLIARADLDTTQAAHSVNQARAASARTRLDKTRIRAPFAGAIGLRDVSVGDYVNVGQDLVQLVRLDPIELEMRAPEVVLSRLSVGQKVQFGVDAYRADVFEAQVVAIAPTVDAGGRSVVVRASLPNPDRKLRPGMSARARIVLATNASALLVPEQAIWPSGEQKMVYLVVDGVAKLVPVTLGARLPGQVQITSGVKAGDEVIVAGQLKIADGAKVATKPADPPPPAAAPAAPESVAN